MELTSIEGPHSAGEGHSLQPAAGTATAAKTGVTSPTSPIQSPGYRLGGGDPEKVVSSPPGTEQPPLNTTDQSEREKRLQAIKQREVCQVARMWGSAFLTASLSHSYRKRTSMRTR